MLIIDMQFFFLGKLLSIVLDLPEESLSQHSQPGIIKNSKWNLGTSPLDISARAFVGIWHRFCTVIKIAIRTIRPKMKCHGT
jgi:hypothetical protein